LIEFALEQHPGERVLLPVLLARLFGDLTGFVFGGELLVVCHGASSLCAGSLEPVRNRSEI